MDKLPSPLGEVLRYWKGLGGETLECAWNNFDLMKLPLDLVPSTMVVDVGSTMDENRYRFWGTRMTSIRGIDLTGQNPYQIDDKSNARKLRQEHGRTIEDGIARASLVQLEWESGVTHHHYSLRLPLSDDGRRIHQLVILIDLDSQYSDSISGFQSARNS